jgi:hypothetical protein
LVLYGVFKAATVIANYGTPELMKIVWGVDDMALLSGVVNYWILDRTLAKRGL